MRALIPALFIVVCNCTSAPEKVAIPGTPLAFDVVPLPGGKTKFGEPAREIDLHPVKMGVKEVTWAEFNAFFESKKNDADTTPTRATSYFGQVGVPSAFLEPQKPVTNVRWHSAMAYCAWLSRKTGGYWRLPTEPEWEAAAGPLPEKLDAVAWVKENSQARTHEGGEKPANAGGFQDLLGNLWEYCLEFRDGSEFSPVLKGGCWSTPAAEIKTTFRQGVPLSWFEEDPNRPRSVWWLTNKDQSQGFRVVCAADPSDQKEREAAAAKVEVKIASNKEKTLATGKSQAFFAEVAGEIRNGGDRTLEEVEVMVWYLDPKGKPHLVDVAGSNKPGQATFSKGWPVLANAYHEAARAPLKPGESRKFTIDLPQTFDSDDDVDREKFGGRASNVRISK